VLKRARMHQTYTVQVVQSTQSTRGLGKVPRSVTVDVHRDPVLNPIWCAIFVRKFCITMGKHDSLQAWCTAVLGPCAWSKYREMLCLDQVQSSIQGAGV
jgi:hypothetical protein